MPMMKSLIDRRLSTTSGHCILVTADEPIWIPEALELEALKYGMVEVADQPTAIEAPAKIDDNVDEDEVVFGIELDQALIRLLTLNDEKDFKKNGDPRAASVIAEMDPECRRPTGTEISDSYRKLQDNVNLAE